MSRGDLAAAREEQFKSVQLITLLGEFGYMAAAKAVMERLGVPVGPPRPPHSRLTPTQLKELAAGLDRLGFSGWLE